MMRRLWSAGVGAMLIVSMLQGSARAAHAGGDGTVSYLALGTSLAVGFQPGPGETPRGYVDDLWRTMQQQIPGLALRNVGCPGETTRSMITGNALAVPLRGRVAARRGGRLPGSASGAGRVHHARGRRERRRRAVPPGLPAASIGRARPTCFPGCRPG